MAVGGVHRSLACPESDVPAARKVIGTPSLLAMGRMRRTSASLCTLTTILGLRLHGGRYGESQCVGGREASSDTPKQFSGATLDVIN